MYIIMRASDGMWLMGHMEGGCSAPTCLWGDRRRDALRFYDISKARKMAKRIGDCAVCSDRGDQLEYSAANTRPRRA